ncbi:S66 peptidase family protein [Marinilabilia rubra]|uniref:LD-carboxypeptidase n=1 Tax=Marinilabilia rubra TaxID=2162893 RepID=A0A2U2BB25_9BACT|nr:LD-carboxypeptidase [Marinilabilia rubra]PWE00274.1 LD-carboxypeptidase [Marinilabilia rubra]
MSIALPPFLKKGALFGLVAPAGKLDTKYIDLAEKFIEANGFRSKRGAYPDKEYYQFSGTDDQRTRDLQTMIDDPEVDVIWCCRGGYGAIRILENLDFSNMPENPKWLVGFSDITVFHSALQNIYNVASIHGPMPVNLDHEKSQDREHLIDLLLGHDVDYKTQPSHLNRKGTAGGQLIGGNLSLLCNLSGSKYDFDPAGKILFIEEVGEQLYHLDRMMHNLKLSGKLEHLTGLVVGQFTNMKDNLTPFGKSANEIIYEAVQHYAYPVIFDFPSGHSSPNEPLLLGAQAHIQVNDEGGMMVYV